MLEAVPNLPLDVNFFVCLVTNSSDFRLMMPTVELPFNAKQWENKLDKEQGNYSYKVFCQGKIVGHFALLRVDHSVSTATLGLVYLAPALRHTGVSRKLLELAEKIGREDLKVKTMLLNVRSTNLPAYSLYRKFGYEEYERDGDLVRMKKTLH